MCRDKHYDPIPSQFEGLAPDEYFEALFRHDTPATLLELAVTPPVIEETTSETEVDPIEEILLTMNGFARIYYRQGMKRAQKFQKNSRSA